MPDLNLTSHIVIANAAGGFGGVRQAIAYAICATPPGATTRLGATTGATIANSTSTTTNECPGNSRTTGVGAAASTGPDIGGFVVVNWNTINLPRKEATAEAAEALNPGANVACDLDVFNICWAH